MRKALLVLFLAVFPMALLSQTPSGHPISDYVGTYTDSPGHAVEIVAGDEIFAVQDETKYKLQASGVDEFAPAFGSKLAFRRDAGGKVIGYEQNGKFHPRISSEVSPEAAALGRPRPERQNSPAAYRYRIPTDLHDDIEVGNIAQSDLGVATANAIVRSILDGTYEDVHSVLLFQ